MINWFRDLKPPGIPPFSGSVQYRFDTRADKLASDKGSPESPVSSEGPMQLFQKTPQLPPLILHPFSGGNGVDDLLEGSRASLALQGLLESSEEEASSIAACCRAVIRKCACSCFWARNFPLAAAVRGVCQRPLGFRSARHRTELCRAGGGRSARSGALQAGKMGCNGSPRRFLRAIGLHSLFQDPPPADSLSPIFLKNYHRFADHAYICFQHLEAFLPLDARRFEFEIYASEEYARILSDQWEEDTQ